MPTAEETENAAASEEAAAATAEAPEEAAGVTDPTVDAGAGAGAGEMLGEAHPPDPEPAVAPPVQAPAQQQPRPITCSDPAVQRLLKLRVPVIVQLARRTMPIATARSLSVGSIIEFEKNVEDPLDLLIGAAQIGHGLCVKADENFGLRITAIASRADRVKSMAENPRVD